MKNVFYFHLNTEWNFCPPQYLFASILRRTLGLEESRCSYPGDLSVLSAFQTAAASTLSWPLQDLRPELVKGPWLGLLHVVLKSTPVSRMLGEGTFFELAIMFTVTISFYKQSSTRNCGHTLPVSLNLWTSSPKVLWKMVSLKDSGWRALQSHWKDQPLFLLRSRGSLCSSFIISYKKYKRIIYISRHYIQGQGLNPTPCMILNTVLKNNNNVNNNSF